MKKIITLLAILFLAGISQAQKKPAQLPGSEGPTQEEMKNAISNWTLNLDDIAPKALIKLKKFYKADDGSLIYIRQIDDLIYALAERYDNRFVSVFVGKIEAEN